MDQLRAAAQEILQAIDDIRILTPREWQAVHAGKVEALREALAEPAEQEPVAWYCYDTKGKLHFFDNPGELGLRHPLYTAPQPAKREPLTEAQWQSIARAAREAFFECSSGGVTAQIDCAAHAAMRETEAAHGITKVGE